MIPERLSCKLQVPYVKEKIREDRIMELFEDNYEDNGNNQNIGIMLELFAEQKSMVIFAEYALVIRADGD